jgi:hypothetical protein
MEEYLKVEIEKDSASNDVKPRGISVTRPRSGDFFDAIEDQNKDGKHHVPSMNDLRVIEKYASYMIPKNLYLFSKDELDGTSVAGLYYSFTIEKNSEFIPVVIEKYKRSFYILVKIDY